MATMTVSLPDALKTWIEQQVATGDYASTSDYIRDAVRRDRERREPDRQITIEELREMIAEGDASGESTNGAIEVFKEARRMIAARRARVA